jgi:hypothetical protein
MRMLDASARSNKNLTLLSEFIHQCLYSRGLDRLGQQSDAFWCSVWLLWSGFDRLMKTHNLDLFLGGQATKKSVILTAT